MGSFRNVPTIPEDKALAIKELMESITPAADQNYESKEIESERKLSDKFLTQKKHLMKAIQSHLPFEEAIDHPSMVKDTSSIKTFSFDFSALDNRDTLNTEEIRQSESKPEKSDTNPSTKKSTLDNTASYDLDINNDSGSDSLMVRKKKRIKTGAIACFKKIHDLTEAKEEKSTLDNTASHDPEVNYDSGSDSSTGRRKKSFKRRAIARRKNRHDSTVAEEDLSDIQHQTTINPDDAKPEATEKKDSLEDQKFLELAALDESLSSENPTLLPVENSTAQKVGTSLSFSLRKIYFDSNFNELQENGKSDFSSPCSDSTTIAPSPPVKPPPTKRGRGRPPGSITKGKKRAKAQPSKQKNATKTSSQTTKKKQPKKKVAKDTHPAESEEKTSVTAAPNLTDHSDAKYQTRAKSKAKATTQETNPDQSLDTAAGATNDPVLAPASVNNPDLATDPTTQNLRKLIDFNQLATEMKEKEKVHGLFTLLKKTYYPKVAVKRNDDDFKELSYSALYATASTGFSVDMYPCSHLYERDTFQYHLVMAVTFVIPQNFCIVFYSDTLHNGNASRRNENHKVGCCRTMEVHTDERYFMYLQETISFDHGVGTKVTRSCTGIAPDARISPKAKMVCERIKDGSGCDHCDTHAPQGKKVIDIANLFGEKLKDFQSGQVVLGDLREFGFIIMRSVDHRSDINMSVNYQMYNKSHCHKSIEDPNRLMMFNENRKMETVEKRIKENCIVTCFMDKIRASISKAIGKDLAMISPNIIYNAGVIERDQLPHYDYKEANKEVPGEIRIVRGNDTTLL